MGDPSHKSGIYKITNVITKKIYIGSAVDLESRWSKHKRYARGKYHHSITFQRSWDLHGEEAFVFEVLEYVSDTSKLAEYEQLYLDKFKPFDPSIGYNICKVGKSHVGLKRSDQARENMRQAQLGLVRSFEHREAIGAGNSKPDKWPCPERSRCKCDRCRKIKCDYIREIRWAKEDEKPIVIRKWSCPLGSLCKCDKCKVLRTKDRIEYLKRKNLSGRQRQ